MKHGDLGITPRRNADLLIATYCIETGTHLLHDFGGASAASSFLGGSQGLNRPLLLHHQNPRGSHRMGYVLVANARNKHIIGSKANAFCYAVLLVVHAYQTIEDHEDFSTVIGVPDMRFVGPV
jgi:hypothetical protein